MDRGLYPEGVEVHQTDLQRTEYSKIFHILSRYIDGNTGGVVNGLLVTSNISNPSTIDIAPGRGYPPNGEYTELLSSVTGLSLADDTGGARNFVLLVYTETNDNPQPHETIPGDVRATAANRSVRTEILTEAQFTPYICP